MTAQRLMDYKLVRQCAPTLAARKVGSLFCMKKAPAEHEPLCAILARWNRELNPSGIFVRIVAERCGRSFVYVYRRNVLSQLFNEAEIRQFLGVYGYQHFDEETLIAKLTHRIAKCHCFPHEIGLFLGYPLEDVKGFIANGGQNCKSTGYWKVYGNVAESEKKFECFRKCFSVMSSLFERGYSLPMLAVASRKKHSIRQPERNAA